MILPRGNITSPLRCCGRRRHRATAVCALSPLLSPSPLSQNGAALCAAALRLFRRGGRVCTGEPVRGWTTGLLLPPAGFMPSCAQADRLHGLVHLCMQGSAWAANWPAAPLCFYASRPGRVSGLAALATPRPAVPGHAPPSSPWASPVPARRSFTSAWLLASPGSVPFSCIVTPRPGTHRRQVTASGSPWAWTKAASGGLASSPSILCLESTPPPPDRPVPLMPPPLPAAPPPPLREPAPPSKPSPPEHHSADVLNGVRAGWPGLHPASFLLVRNC